MVALQTIEAASLGMWDSFILMVMALVVFGPRRLPEIGRQIGRLMYEVRKASNDFKFQMEDELRKAEDADRRKKEEERLALLPPAPPAAPSLPVQDPQFPIPSPYPEEGVYPDISPADYQDSAPRIQPPSTGEPVAANPPMHTPEAAAPANPYEPAPTTEQANHG